MGKQMTEDRRFYFCDEVATEIRRTEAAVRWLWSSGQLKSRMIGGRRVSTAADLDDFFQAAS